MSDEKSILDIVLDLTQQLKRLENRVDILNHNFTKKVKDLDNDDLKINQNAIMADITAKITLNCLLENNILNIEQVNKISNEAVGQDIVKKKTIN